MGGSQWRNEFEWRPTAQLKWRRPLQKTNKKGRHFFFGFSDRLVAPPGPFILTNFFSPPNVNLAPLIVILPLP